MQERQWGEKREGLAISIAVPKTDFTGSDNVVLEILLQNFGTTSVSLLVRSPWIDYTYVVRNGHGQEMTMNEYGRQRGETVLEGRKIMSDLPPGVSRSDEFELSKAFNLKPDTYTVVVMRTLPWPGRPGASLQVQSNVIALHTTD